MYKLTLFTLELSYLAETLNYAGYIYQAAFSSRQGGHCGDKLKECMYHNSITKLMKNDNINDSSFPDSFISFVAWRSLSVNLVFKTFAQVYFKQSINVTVIQYTNLYCIL